MKHKVVNYFLTSVGQAVLYGGAALLCMVFFYHFIKKSWSLLLYCSILLLLIECVAGLWGKRSNIRFDLRELVKRERISRLVIRLMAAVCVMVAGIVMESVTKELPQGSYGTYINDIILALRGAGTYFVAAIFPTVFAIVEYLLIG